MEKNSPSRGSARLAPLGPVLPSAGYAALLRKDHQLNDLVFIAFQGFPDENPVFHHHIAPSAPLLWNGDRAGIEGFPFFLWLLAGFIPWFYIVNMVSAYHFKRSNLPWRSLTLAHTPFFLYLELNKSAASTLLVTACFYSM